MENQLYIISHILSMAVFYFYLHDLTSDRCTEPRFKASIQRNWSNHYIARPTHTPMVYVRIVCSYTLITSSSTSLTFYFFNFLVLLYFYLHFYNTYSASKLQSQLPPLTAFRSQRPHFSVCSSLLCNQIKHPKTRDCVMAGNGSSCFSC